MSLVARPVPWTCGVRPYPVRLYHLTVPMSSVMSACNKASPTDMPYVYVPPWPVHSDTSLSPSPLCPMSSVLVTSLSHAVHVRTTMACLPLSPPHPHVLGHACNKASPMLCMYVRPWPVHLCHLPIPVSSVMSACNKASPMLYMYVRPWPVYLCHFPIPVSSVMSACNKASPTDMLYMYVRPWPVHLYNLPIPMSSVTSTCNLACPHGLAMYVLNVSV